MKNKYVVTFIFPNIEEEFDAYIPNNKKLGTVKKKILDIITENSNYVFNKNFEFLKFIDRDNGVEFENNVYIKDTGIKNGSKIIVL